MVTMRKALRLPVNNISPAFILDAPAIVNYCQIHNTHLINMVWYLQILISWIIMSALLNKSLKQWFPNYSNSFEWVSPTV